jgi:hypothetical protein
MWIMFHLEALTDTLAAVNNVTYTHKRFSNFFIRLWAASLVVMV